MQVDYLSIAVYSNTDFAASNSTHFSILIFCNQEFNHDLTRSSALVTKL